MNKKPTRGYVSRAHEPIAGIIAAPEQKQGAILAGLEAMRDHLLRYSINGCTIDPSEIANVDANLNYLFGRTKVSSNLSLASGEENIEGVIESAQRMVLDKNSAGLVAEIMNAETVGDILQVLQREPPFSEHEGSRHMFYMFRHGSTRYLTEHYRKQTIASGTNQLTEGGEPPRR